MKTQQADPVRDYLQVMGRIPMLTKEEEVQYGQQVQRLMKLNEIKAELSGELDREPTEAEWARQAGVSLQELKREIAAGNRSKRRMVESNLRLVVSVAKKYLKSNVDFLDLIQEGNIGLQRGVEKFDPSKGYRFSTYAYWWIRQAMTRAILQTSRTIRLPVHIGEKLNKIFKAQRQLGQKLGRVATVEELAAETNLKSEEVEKYLRYARPPVSLDIRIGEQGGTELGDLLEDEGSSAEDFVVRSCLNSDLQKLLSGLAKKEQEVLSLRFGFEGTGSLSFRKVADLMNLSAERVRQIERKALEKLREYRGDLQEYLVG